MFTTPLPTAKFKPYTPLPSQRSLQSIAAPSPPSLPHLPDPLPGDAEHVPLAPIEEDRESGYASPVHHQEVQSHAPSETAPPIPSHPADPAPSFHYPLHPSTSTPNASTEQILFLLRRDHEEQLRQLKQHFEEQLLAFQAQQRPPMSHSSSRSSSPPPPSGSGRATPNVIGTLPHYSHPRSAIRTHDEEEIEFIKKNTRRPEPFSGDAKSSETSVHLWVTNMKNFLLSGNVTSGDRQIVLATSFLTGPANVWWCTLPINERNQISDFDSLSQKLITRFRPLNIINAARSKLLGDDFKQLPNAKIHDWNQMFLTTAQLVQDMSDADKIALYRRKIRDDLKLHLVTRTFTNLTDLMNAAAEIDGLLKNISKPTNTYTGYRSTSYNKPRSYPPPSSALHHVNTYEHQKEPGSDGEEGEQSTPSGEPAQLNAVLTKMDEAERDRCRKNNLCFRCREPGHRSRQCPKFTSSFRPSTDVSKNFRAHSQ